MSETPIILDAGNAQIKVACPNGTVLEDCFPHIMAQLSSEEYARISNRTAKTDPDYFLINDVPYVTGDKAKRKGAFKRKHGSARYTAAYYGVFLAMAMAKTFQRSVKNVFLVGSHSPKDVNYADDLMSASVQSWDVRWMGNTYNFNVVDAVTFDEPLGGWANTILRKDGRNYANKQINDGVTLVLDIGAYTTDGLIIDPGGSIDYSTANSEVIGVLNAVEQFTRDFRTRHADRLKRVPQLDETKVHEAIRTGQFDLRGLGVIDCQELVDEVCSALVADIVNFYDSYGGSANFDYVILTGGGSALLEKYLRKEIDHHSILLADDETVKLHMANVRGGLKWYRMHEALQTFTQ